MAIELATTIDSHNILLHNSIWSFLPELRVMYIVPLLILSSQQPSEVDKTDSDRLQVIQEGSWLSRDLNIDLPGLSPIITPSSDMASFQGNVGKIREVKKHNTADKERGDTTTLKSTKKHHLLPSRGFRGPST